MRPLWVSWWVWTVAVAVAVAGSPMSETLLKAYANSRGQSPGAKKLLNIPEDGSPTPSYAPPDELERDHALPTSVPNADILKTSGGTAHRGRVPPSYSPPPRGSFTPPLPPAYNNPFADKPTLRGTSADAAGYVNRRPIPPPSHLPGHARIPIRPGQDAQVPSQVPSPQHKKKALNTPSQRADDAPLVDEPASNRTDHAPYNINSISRILSGPNGRREDIPDIFLRSVTAKPSTVGEPTRRPDDEPDSSTEGSALPVLDPDAGPPAPDGEANTRRNLQFATNRNSEDKAERARAPDAAPTTAAAARDAESSTERFRTVGAVAPPAEGAGHPSSYGGRKGITWPLAWHLHVYFATAAFTILAVCSVSKIFCYDKFTHLFTQYYFIALHLALVSVCLMRIFYMCYDPYNVNGSLPPFLGDVLLHVPEIFLSAAFSATILFLLINSINLKNGCYSMIARPRTVVIGGVIHVIVCIVLHAVENFNYGRGSFHSIERKMFGLICQIVYIVACTSLGLVYLYVYKTLKKILRKKSHSYIQGFQNLYQAIHINLATAMLFILLAVLQIYGLFGITIRVNMTKFNWLQWGYQFSLRLIEMSIIALLCWVVSLKVGMGSNVQHEKGDGHKITGLGLFPCAAGSSNEQFDSDYPAICTTNTNLHTYTLRTGKPVYDAGMLASRLQGSEQCCSAGVEGQRFQINSLAAACDSNSIAENYSGRSSIANATHSSSTESSNAASTQSASNHLMKGHHGPAGGKMPGYIDNLSASDDHYSNCDPVMSNVDPSGSDHEYNVIQYGNRGNFVRDHKNAGGSVRGSQNNFKHLSFDRLSSRNNSGHNMSNPRRKQRGKQKNQPNCMTLGGMGYEGNARHYHHPHVTDVADYGYPSDNASFHISGIQTLNPVKSYYDSTSIKQTGFRDSQRKNRNESPLTSSGSQKRGKNPGSDRPKSTDLYGFAEATDDIVFTSVVNGNRAAADVERTGDERRDDSMLVAQDGFVRFRQLEDGPT